ncbi:hypothetical protein [Saccharospirillum impatiens]|uniref:hypothetical protein n=1 Tax=Saccharospirillum impatiens TaxID=169438 RepID=UPI0003F54A46|nr:hypothetical protein [Saccharospirillum impatiens]
MSLATTLRSLLVGCAGVLPLSAPALEFSMDLGLASGENAVGWGVASHVQIMDNTRWGLDLGYRYHSELEYPTDNGTLNHDFRQYEMGLIWQQGHTGARFQGVGGLILAGDNVVGNADESVLNAGALGYHLDADISVPLVEGLRVFANAGYQDYFSGDMPAQWRWRYGVRYVFGERMSAAERDARARAEAAQAPPQNTANAVDTEQPERRVQPIPTYLSQSLPPIIERSELCKCFPAGPYTLQLGQFPNMERAVRAMEYRGLRQFFTTIAYDRDPQPVFLAQAEPEGPVGLFLGEYEQLADSEIWRRRLRLSGIEGRIRRVVGSDGRVENRTVDASAQARTPRYTAEEIRRMNSVSPDVGVNTQLNRQTLNQAAVAGQDASSHSTPAVMPDSNYVPGTLILGPVSPATLTGWMSEPSMRDALLTDTTRRLPGRHRLIWDAARNQAWVYLDRFSSTTQIDEWQAWLEGKGQVASLHQSARLPVGDVYVYFLGDGLHGYSLELHQQADASDMLQRLVSPEVLWFQAYQSINEEPPTLVLQWNASDQRYHLIATGFARDNDARRAWQNLSSVGLMPVLQE